MGTTLTGTTPANTYDSLIKVTDNGPLSGTAKYLSDGLGNDSALALSTSRVGIGTTSPSLLLDIVGTSSVGVKVTETGGSDARLVAGGSIAYLGTYSNHPLTILTNSGEKMRITSAGNVGIGTSNPLSKFEVNGDGAFKVASGNVGYSLQSGTDAYSFYLNDADNSFRIYSSNGATDRFTLTSAGNVGIGTTSPSEKLVVSGGALQVSGVLSSLNRPSSSVIDFLGGTARIFSIGADSSTHGSISFSTSTTTTNLERAVITTGGYFRLTANSGGIQFNGDTAAANALDDYEEGTWTMGISFGGGTTGIVYANNTGTYTKVGRKVTVNGYIGLSSKGSSTGAVAITGLPFAIPNVLANYAVASVYLDKVTFANQFEAIGAINTTNILLSEITALGGVSALTNADFADNSEIVVNFTYFV